MGFTDVGMQQYSLMSLQHAVCGRCAMKGLGRAHRRRVTLLLQRGADDLHAPAAPPRARRRPRPAQTQHPTLARCLGGLGNLSFWRHRALFTRKIHVIRARGGDSLEMARCLSYEAQRRALPGSAGSSCGGTARISGRQLDSGKWHWQSHTASS